MMKKLLVAAALLGLGAGCVVEAGHIHSADCGHFQHRGGWHYSPGHIHRDGCGHLLRGGVWVGID
jgi:hypothetical protein